MQTKVKIWVYVLSGLVLYFGGSMTSLMYENGLPLNIAWNWVIKGSSQIQGFMILGAILTFVWMDLILHLVRIRQWLFLAIFSILFVIGYSVSHYLFFLLLGAFGLVNLAYLAYVLYKEKNTSVPVEDKMDTPINESKCEKEDEMEQLEVEENIQEDIDLLQDDELQEKIDALFDSDIEVDLKASELEASTLTIDSLTEEYLDKEQDC